MNLFQADCPGSFLNPNATGRAECKDCKQRCNSLFPGDQGMINGCRNACASGNSSIWSQQDYLSIIGQGQEAIDDYNDEIANNEQSQNKIFMQIGIGVLTVLLALAIIKKFG